MVDLKTDNILVLFSFSVPFKDLFAQFFNYLGAIVAHMIIVDCKQVAQKTFFLTETHKYYKA